MKVARRNIGGSLSQPEPGQVAVEREIMADPEPIRRDPMDFTSALRADSIRPIATLVLPGAAAIAPYVLLASHYNDSIAQFSRANTGIYVVLVAMAALAAGFILEDFGSRIEGLVWDRLVEKETACHASDWYAFLNLAPATEKIGHRYLRTITLRLKFELAFGLALICLWFGLLWLDAVKTLWSYESTVLLSAVLLGMASYTLWESYGSIWVLARLRHLIVHGVPCKMQIRPEDAEPWRRRFDRFLLASALVSFFWGSVIGTAALTTGRRIGHDSGLMTAVLCLAFAFTLTLTWWWFATETDAAGRRRGTALRLALAYTLFAAFAHARQVFASPPFNRLTFWVALLFAGAHLFFANRFWTGNDSLPSAQPETPVAIPDAT